MEIGFKHLLYYKTPKEKNFIDNDRDFQKYISLKRLLEFYLLNL